MVYYKKAVGKENLSTEPKLLLTYDSEYEIVVKRKFIFKPFKFIKLFLIFFIIELVFY